MAELTHVAGLVTKDNVKSGAAHPDMMPTVVIFDTTLTRGLPDCVRFGTALRGIEHGIGAVCHPKATPDIRSRAFLHVLDILNQKSIDDLKHRLLSEYGGNSSQGKVKITSRNRTQGPYIPCVTAEPTEIP